MCFSLARKIVQDAQCPKFGSRARTRADKKEAERTPLLSAFYIIRKWL